MPLPPPGAWPFTGRDAELTAAVAAITGGSRGIILRGAPGSGRTRLAREIVRRSRRTVVSADTEAIPAGAILLLDGAQLATSTPRADVPIVATWTEGDPLPRVHARAVADGDLLLIPVSEFTPTGYAELLSAALGAPVAAHAVDQLLRAAGGRLRTFQALAADAVAGRILHPVGGRWVLDQPIATGAATAAELDVVRDLLGADARAELDLLALIEPAPLTARPSPGLDELVATGLARLAPHPDGSAARIARVAAPAHGALLRDRAPVAQTAEVHADMLARLPQRSHGWASLGSLRSIAWGLAAATDIPIPLALDAARLANRIHDYSLAAAIADGVLRRADDPVDRARALLERSFARRFDDAPAEADDDAAEAFALALSAGDRPDAHDALIEAAAARADLAHYDRDDPDAALALLADAAAALPAEATAGAQRLHAERVLHLGYAGRFALCVAENRRLSVRDPVPRLRADAVAGLALATMGSPHAAALRLGRDAVVRRLRIHDRNWSDEELNGALFAALFYSEGVATTERVALRQLSDAASPDSYVRFDVGLSLLAATSIHLAAGRAPEAVASAESAVRAFALRDPSGFVRHAHALAAEAHALAGSVAESARHAARARATPARAAAVLEPDSVRALLRASLVDDSATVTRVHDEATALEVAGALGGAARVLALGVLAGDGASARRLVAMAPRLDGRLHALAVRQAQAVLDGDPAALLEAARRWERLGHLPWAGDTAASAAQLASGRGLVDLAAEAERRATALRALCPGVIGWVHARARPVPGSLTTRERQIAQLLASGASNRDISTALGISVRTVEGHLGRLYRKLDAAGHGAGSRRRPG